VAYYATYSVSAVRLL